MTSDAVETAAQLIHQRHRAGTANVCDGCRGVAREVAEVLDVERSRLSNLLRAMARRRGVLRRAYNISAPDPWENPEWCAKANPLSQCGFAVRPYDLCIYHVRQEMHRLRGIEQRATEVAAGLGSRAKSARLILTGDDDA